MSNYSLWELNMQELIQDFTGDELTAETAEIFLNGIGFDGVNIISDPMSAERLLLVYGNSDYAFTSDDLSWLSVAPSVVTGIYANDISVYVVELACDEDDYYIYCAALIKLINVVFKKNSIIIFKLAEAFAVGSSRNFDSNNYNSFCVSALIHANDVSYHADFLYEITYADACEIPSLIIRYSPQEEARTPPQYFSGRATDPDYLRFLDEVESFYGESVQKERDRFLGAGEERHQRIESYESICKRLLSTAEDDGFTSLEVLEDAETAEQKVVKHENGTLLFPDEEREEEFSEEAYKNAEVMLNELLGRDKN